MAKKNPINKIVISGMAIVIIIIILFVPLFPVTTSNYTFNESTLQKIFQELNIPCNDRVVIKCPELLEIKISKENFIEQNKPNTNITEFIVTDPIINQTFQDGSLIIKESTVVNGTVTDSKTIVKNETDNGIIVVISPEPEPKAEPISMEIVSTIMKTDNTGKITESKTNTGIPLLSFFVEDTSNIDFDNGFIEQFLKIKTKPDTKIQANAQFDLLIDQISIHTNPIKVSIEGITDSNGEISLNFNPLPSVYSENFLFKFSDHIPMFKTTGISKIKFILSEITINVGEQKFGLINSTIYEMDIARDPNKIIITKEDGGKQRVYPSDNSLSITSEPYNYNSCISISGHCYSIPSCQVAPVMGSGNIVHIRSDGIRELLDTFPSNTQGGRVYPWVSSPYNAVCNSISKFSSNTLQRGEVYEIQFSDGLIKFKTPIDQAKSFVFYCRYSDSSGTAYIWCNYKNDQATIDAMKATLVN